MAYTKLEWRKDMAYNLPDRKTMIDQIETVIENGAARIEAAIGIKLEEIDSLQKVDEAITTTLKNRIAAMVEENRTLKQQINGWKRRLEKGPNYLEQGLVCDEILLTDYKE